MWRVILILLLIAVVLGALFLGIPEVAGRTFGPAASHLDPLQRFQYSAKLLWADGLLTRPLQAGALEIQFDVEPGESVVSVCDRLERVGVISSSEILRDYLIYTGMDTSLQAGRYKLGAALSMLELARLMQDATPMEVEFVVLRGWRMEEVAAALPTSGLPIAPEEFLRAAAGPVTAYDFLQGAINREGFLYPDAYVVKRTTGATELLETLVANFAAHLSPQLREGFSAQGLSVYEAVILASIVEREAVRDEEASLIAAVYLNRLRADMRLDADPTVQYALGYNIGAATWWTNPLSLDDLQVDSPFNTYRIGGLPPTPIANPGAQALQAIAAPATTSNYYFSARCDGSGYHNFAGTFEEHVANLCP